MKKIGGLVLVKDTGQGVENLVVAVFDSDLTVDDIRRQELPAQLLRRAGKRISSVLTDRLGRFSISTEDLEFPGNEARPDLLLVVLAPEDVQDIRRPYPLPAEERVLYVSTVPRVDAGAEEAYVIRLLREQMDRFKIDATHGERDVSADVRALAGPSLRAAKFHDGMRAALADQRKSARAAVRETRHAAREKVAGLSAIPLHLRDRKARDAAKLIDGKAELPKRLELLQRKVVEESVATLRKRKSSPTMRLYFTDQQVSDLGLKVDGDTVSGRVSAALLRETVPGFGGITDLVRTRAVAQPRLEELEQRYLRFEAETEPSGPSAPDEP